MSTAQELAEIISELFANCQEKEAKHVARYKVSIADSRSIRILYEHQSLTVNHLAQHMALSSSRVTRIIDRLVTKKLVIREADLTDRRIFNLSLTVQGEKIAKALNDDYSKIHEEILSVVPEHLHNSIIQSLKQLNGAVEAWLLQH